MQVPTDGNDGGVSEPDPSLVLQIANVPTGIHLHGFALSRPPTRQIRTLGPRVARVRGLYFLFFGDDCGGCGNLDGGAVRQSAI